MLVRFLSYAASVIGAKRYKPLLISCLAIVLSITGISMIASSLASGSSDAASRVEQQATDQPKEGDQQSTSLNGLEKKDTKPSDAIQQSPAGSAETTTPKPANTPAGSSTLAITLSAASVNLNTGNPESNTITAATDPATTAQWNIVSDNAGGVTARIENNKDVPGTVTIRFRIETAAAGTYMFTVSAKDTVRGLGASKTVSVTVH